MTRRNSMWISWERHRRTLSLVPYLNTHVNILSSTKPRWLKHPTFLFETLVLLLYRRPKALFVQNPSWVLTGFVLLMKPLFRYYLIVDAHNGGVYPFEPSQERFRRIFRYFHRGADLTIVTNESCAEIVTQNGGRPFVLPDALPEFGILPDKIPRREGITVTFVCSFAADEPYAEVIAAGQFLPEEMIIWITGDARRCPDELRRSAPPSIRFTGFLPESEYVAQLAKSDLVMDLTTLDDCLVCGAYEGIALGIPLILSDTQVNRAYFNRGVIYAQNNRHSLAAALRSFPQSRTQLKRDIVGLREELTTSWRQRLESLLLLIGNALGDEKRAG